MLNVFGPVNRLGMGQHTYHLMRSYEALGRDVCLVPPFGDVRLQNQVVEKWLNNRLRFNPQDPGLMIFDLSFMTQFCGNPRIGMAVFETDRIPALQCAALASCDFLLTPSMWGKSVLEVHGFKKVSVVPEGYDPEIFPFFHEKISDKKIAHGPGICTCAGFPKAMGSCLGGEIRSLKEFTFLHVGKYETRKGTIQVLEAFAEAFQREDVTLLMHINNPFTNDYSEVAKTLSRLNFSSPEDATFRRLGQKIVFGGEMEESLAPLYQRADCGVFPSKGEGWGLPILECLATGIPCIVGRWTAMSDYLSPDYPEELILKDARIVPANDGVWFRGDKGNWFEPATGELVERLRWAYDNAQALRKTEIWRAAASFARKFTWGSAAIKLDYFLKNETSVK